jgi:hypothetical protein
MNRNMKGVEKMSCSEERQYIEHQNCRYTKCCAYIAEKVVLYKGVGKGAPEYDEAVMYAKSIITRMSRHYVERIHIFYICILAGVQELSIISYTPCRRTMRSCPRSCCTC